MVKFLRGGLVGLYRAELWNAWPCLGKRAENELRCSAVPGLETRISLVPE